MKRSLDKHATQRFMLGLTVLFTSCSDEGFSSSAMFPIETTSDGGDEGQEQDGSGGDVTGGGEDDDGGDPIGDFVCPLACDFGRCVFALSTGTPTCECDEGYVSTGNQCIACTVADPTDLQINVPTVELQGIIRVDGDATSLSEYETGAIYLRDQNAGDEILLGYLHESSFSRRVVPGVYDIVYENINGVTIAPRNRHAVINTLAVDSDELLEIDLRRTYVFGDITINGVQPNNYEYEYGRLSLRSADSTGTDDVPLGTTKNGWFDAYVLPGYYDVYFTHVEGSTIVPQNADTKVASDIYISGQSDLRVDIDIPVTRVSGSLTLAGRSPPQSTYEVGRVFLAQGSSEPVEIGSTDAPDFDVRLIPGTYNIVYQYESGVTHVPRNQQANIGTLDVVDEASMNATIDIPVVNITGEFRTGDALTPNDPSDDGILRLINDSGDEVILGNTHGQYYQALVIPGTYNIMYSQETSSTRLPANTFARLGTVDIANTGSTVDIDISAVRVEGTITQNDAEPSHSGYDDARLYLRNRTTGDSVLLANTTQGQFSRMVIPGEYDIVYSVETAGATAAVNQDRILRTVTIESSDSVVDLPVDIPTITATGSITVDATSPPPSGQASISLVDIQTEDEISLGQASNGAFQRQLLSGTYLVRYGLNEENPEWPQNTHAALQCVVLEQPNSPTALQSPQGTSP